MNGQEVLQDPTRVQRFIDTAKEAARNTMLVVAPIIGLATLSSSEVVSAGGVHQCTPEESNAGMGTEIHTAPNGTLQPYGPNCSGPEYQGSAPPPPTTAATLPPESSAPAETDPATTAATSVSAAPATTAKPNTASTAPSGTVVTSEAPTTTATHLGVVNFENDLLPNPAILGADGTFISYVNIPAAEDAACGYDRTPDVAGPTQEAYDQFLADLTALKDFGLKLTDEDFCIIKSEGISRFKERITQAEQARDKAASDAASTSSTTSTIPAATDAVTNPATDVEDTESQGTDTGDTTGDSAVVVIRGSQVPPTFKHESGGVDLVKVVVPVATAGTLAALAVALARRRRHNSDNGLGRGGMAPQAS